MKTEEARELLVKERERLLRIESQVEDSGGLDESQRESTGALSAYDQHLGDAASQTYQRERDMSIKASLASKRKEIADALGRVENGSYGLCEVCGRRIPDERLTALPATRYCAEHASKIADERQAAKGGWSITNELEPDEE